MKNNSPIEVLIVEDNRSDAELILRALCKTRTEKKISLVEDGECALDFIFCKGKYEYRQVDTHLKVILLDIKLPKMNGFDVLKTIRGNNYTKMIPVVMLSSSAEAHDIATAYANGANGYVVKPVNYEDFFYTIQNTGIYWLEVNEV